MGWGHGPHTCAVIHLARLEMEILAARLIGHIASIEVGEPVLIGNNLIYCKFLRGCRPIYGSLSAIKTFGAPMFKPMLSEAQMELRLEMLNVLVRVHQIQLTH